MIKYGISKNYLQDWTIQDAIREVYQNFLDFGEYKLETKEDDGNYINIKFFNDYKPENLNFLAVGESGKRNDNSTIGKHGEGLKMAFLVLAREECEPQLTCNNYVYEGCFYKDENLGECFGFKKYDEDELLYEEPFTVEFSVPKEEWENFNTRIIAPEEIIYSDYYYGDLIDKPAGDIYVGGLYVCNLPEFKYAYNFKPERIELDRDRKVPRAFDVEYNASQILNNANKIDMKNLYSRDTQYIHSVPSNISKKFKPKLKNNRVIFENQSGKQAPERIATCLLNDPLQKKRVAKLKYNVSRKRTPENILKEFYSMYKYKLDASAQIDFNNIIKKAKDWKY